MQRIAYILASLAMLALLTACTALAPGPAPAAAKVQSGSASNGNNSQTASRPIRVSGSVAGISQDTVTLADGTSFATTPQTRVTQLEPITTADLKPGLYVAITAKLQSDNTLLASTINVFDESMRGLAPGQRPMTDGNLMTNATIDKIEKVEGDTFTVSWEGGSAQVQIAPNAMINRITIKQISDIKEGNVVSASLVDGVAQSVSLQ